MAESAPPLKARLQHNKAHPAFAQLPPASATQEQRAAFRVGLRQLYQDHHADRVEIITPSGYELDPQSVAAWNCKTYLRACDHGNYVLALQTAPAVGIPRDEITALYALIFT